MQRNTKRLNKKHEKVVARKNEREAIRKAENQNQQRAAAKAIIVNDEIPESEYVDFPCSNCNFELSYTKEQLRSGEELVCPMCDTPISKIIEFDVM